MKSKLLLKTTVLLVTFASMADMVVIPAVGGIFASFPDASPFLMGLFLTGPLLLCVIGSVLCGFLAQYISKKYLLIGAYVLFIIASCGGALIDNIYYIVAMRLLVGLSYGLSMTLGMGIIAEVFLDEKERSFMMGANSSAASALGIAMSLLGGYLAVGNWHHSYYVYLAAIPILIMIIAFVPKTPPEGKKASDVAASGKERLPIAKMLPVVVSYLIFNALYYIALYYIAIYLEEVKLGDASTAGIMSSLSTIGSLCAGILFSIVYMRVKRGTPIIAFLVMAGTFIVLAFPSNIWVIGIMCFMGGLAYNFGSSYYFMHTSMIAPPGVMSLAMGIITATMGIGGFLSSYALSLYQAVLKVNTMTPTFLYIGITLAIGGLLSILLTIKSKKNPVSVGNTNA
ncbi:MAG: MFS transporter [Clostridiales bacterium]|jgi:MFS family permease|nr:MFS transporter [Eubacteriales bacterium]MDH7567927.1 MFS transporter [Clostridiales bacterium]